MMRLVLKLKNINLVHYFQKNNFLPWIIKELQQFWKFNFNVITIQRQFGTNEFN